MSPESKPTFGSWMLFPLESSVAVLTKIGALPRILPGTELTCLALNRTSSPGFATKNAYFTYGAPKTRRTFDRRTDFPGVVSTTLMESAVGHAVIFCGKGSPSPTSGMLRFAHSELIVSVKRMPFGLTMVTWPDRCSGEGPKACMMLKNHSRFADWKIVRSPKSTQSQGPCARRVEHSLTSWPFPCGGEFVITQPENDTE